MRWVCRCSIAWVYTCVWLPPVGLLAIGLGASAMHMPCGCGWVVVDSRAEPLLAAAWCSCAASGVRGQRAHQALPWPSEGHKVCQPPTATPPPVVCLWGAWVGCVGPAEAG
jgi:hypothetical protein